MKTFEYHLNYENSHYIETHYPINDLCLFDIETTGFSPEITNLYLIGVMYYDSSSKNYVLKQYFNDDNTVQSEIEIISEFMNFISSFTYLFHYNGDGFDIPYINKKISIHNLNYSFNNIKSIDIYKHIKPYKKALYLDNLKQKSIEQYLYINRVDKYSGGDLIKIYQNYVKSPNEKILKLLLQHNYDDVEGMLLISEILCYKDLFDGHFVATNCFISDNKFHIKLKLNYPIPKRINRGTKGIILTGLHENVTLSVPIYTGELKFFFKDYSNYYYLPVEDKAIHKSVATYVDKDYREKANKSNCYVKKSGSYVRQKKDLLVYGYRENYDDKDSYIDIHDTLENNIENLNLYSNYLLEELKITKES